MEMISKDLWCLHLYNAPSQAPQIYINSYQGRPAFRVAYPDWQVRFFHLSINIDLQYMSCAIYVMQSQFAQAKMPSTLQYDEDWQRRGEEASAQGLKLCYVGQIDVENQSCKVGLQANSFLDWAQNTREMQSCNLSLHEGWTLQSNIMQPCLAVFERKPMLKC